ncbi:hypothetical protein NDU88_006629 [Pleurodeles waltl]|uniref:Uncharacterized protein n=1 Tax=Pleurodeles waltl TaxID=8319 RepID=A0AAV7TXP9_PLEWA|nr:hypothetical protein NDU88_006629 [Pleurodeles waltl]
MHWESGYPDSQRNKGQSPWRPGEEEKERDAEETGRRPDQQRPEDLKEKGTTDGGQGGPETRGLCHVPGGAWLKQIRSCFQSRIKSLVGREEGAGGEREKREEGRELNKVQDEEMEGT